MTKDETKGRDSMLERLAGILRRRREEEEEYEPERLPIRRCMPDYHMGLYEEEIIEREEAGWTNDPVDPPSKTTRDIIHDNVFTYFNLIFAILGLLLIMVGAFRDLTFLPVIILNTMIGIIQEIRAKNVLDKMTMLHAPKATVVRNGRKRVIAVEDLVIDDIVIFKAGNQICADAIVEHGEVQVNESLLTGEADEITKKKGDILMSGSFIVSGECHARLEKVGADSYISRLTLEAKAMKDGEQSEMIRSLDKLVKCVGIAIIPIGLILFIQSFFLNEESFRSSVTAMVAAVIGMVPEGLYLLASVALAVSAVRLAKQKVLLHDMKSIETLARVNVLCVDKTGTITENTMKVQGLRATRHYDKETMPPLKGIIGDFAQSMSKDNITMEAVQTYFQKRTGRRAQKITSFSSEFKYSSATFEDGSYVLGAPEFVLREDYPEYEEEIREEAAKGYRVLVFGSCDETPDGRELKGKVTPLAYIMLANPIRKEAPKTFAYFEEQGVEVKVISGDNPLTVSEVAKKAGITGAENYVDAATLTTEEEIRQAVLKYTVFGRVTPAQKRRFVKALKGAGRTVAMTGDGVNDVLALKDADCSIAMASGSDAAAQASQLVLLESDFSCMPSVVLEGRRVVNNIQRSASLFLVKNIFSFLLSIFSAVFMITYPLEPSQVSLISMFTIGVPAFFLALEPNKNIIKGHFLTNVFLKALPAALTDVLAVGALVVFGATFSVSPTDISTAATMLLAIVGFMILYRISQPMNRIRVAVLAGCICALLFCSTVLNQLFAITDMSAECVMLFVVFSIATEPVLRYLTVFVGSAKSFYDKVKGKIFIGKKAGEEA